LKSSHRSSISPRLKYRILLQTGERKRKRKRKRKGRKKTRKKERKMKEKRDERGLEGTHKKREKRRGRIRERTLLPIHIFGYATVNKKKCELHRDMTEVD